MSLTPQERAAIEAAIVYDEARRAAKSAMREFPEESRQRLYTIAFRAMGLRHARKCDPRELIDEIAAAIQSQRNESGVTAADSAPVTVETES